MVKVKICGVRTLEGARAVVEAGADFVGLNFVPSSRRYLGEGPLRAELAEVLRSVATVGVFADAPVAVIEQIQTELGLDYLQLHGDESPTVCAALSRHARIIKAMRVDGAFDPERLEAFRPHVAFFLFDGPRPGHGESFAWAALRGANLGVGPERRSEADATVRGVVDSPARPVFVAGGLSPENVSEAISVLRPFGVDTASGVELNGVVDPSRVREFVERARRG